MTENPTTTDAAAPETTPSDAATTDALESVTTTEQTVTPDDASDSWLTSPAMRPKR